MNPPESLETPAGPNVPLSEEVPKVIYAYPPMPLAWRLYILGGIVAIGILAYVLRDTIGLRGQAFVGIIFFFGLVAAFSANLRAVNWQTIGWGIALQVILALLVLR